MNVHLEEIRILAMETLSYNWYIQVLSTCKSKGNCFGRFHLPHWHRRIPQSLAVLLGSGFKPNTYDFLALVDLEAVILLLRGV